MVEANVLHLSDLSFGDLVLGSKGYVLVDFYVAASPECQKLGVIIDELSFKYRNKISMAKFDVEKNSGISSRYRVTMIPTLILFKNGEEIDRTTGFISEEKLVSYLNEKLKR